MIGFRIIPEAVTGGVPWKRRLVFSRFFDFRGNLENVKEKPCKRKEEWNILKKEGFSSFLPFTNRRNATILVYKKGILKNFANVTGKNLHWNLFLIKL